jgi:hypothetical protein
MLVGGVLLVRPSPTGIDDADMCRTPRTTEAQNRGFRRLRSNRSNAETAGTPRFTRASVRSSRLHALTMLTCVGRTQPTHRPTEASAVSDQTAVSLSRFLRFLKRRSKNANRVATITEQTAP